MSKTLKKEVALSNAKKNEAERTKVGLNKTVVDDVRGLTGEELERGKNRRSKARKINRDEVPDVNNLMHLVSAGMENLSADELNKLEEQKKKLRYLLGKGKERGYVTNSEINDNLPDHITDPEIIDQIIYWLCCCHINPCFFQRFNRIIYTSCF